MFAAARFGRSLGRHFALTGATKLFFDVYLKVRFDDRVKGNQHAPARLVFEGDSATAAVDALSRSPGVLKAAVRWRRILGGRPRLAEERFGWTRAS